MSRRTNSWQTTCPCSGRLAKSSEELGAAFRQIDQDMEEGILVHAPVAWTGAFRRTDELSQRNAAHQGQRTIDLLHVAIALEFGAETLLSFDRRQRRLAQAASLKVKP